VAISDSFGIASDKKLLNIFRAFESALENCAVALTESASPVGSIRVIFASAMEKGCELPVPECHVENFLDSDANLVAHLALRMLAPRTEFVEDELEAIRKAVRALRPLILQWLAKESEKEKSVA
jgi:hypothetical protein